MATLSSGDTLSLNNLKTYRPRVPNLWVLCGSVSTPISIQHSL